MTDTDDSQASLLFNDVAPAPHSNDPVLGRRLPLSEAGKIDRSWKVGRNAEEHVAEPDPWYEWLLHHRGGDDPTYGQFLRADTERYADRVIDGAALAPGMILADIGTGEGLVAFRAIDRIGPSLSVILTDISAALLTHTQALAAQRGVKNKCSFLQCAADRLTNIQNASVDAVTTRSVLAYVADKAAALREFFRILKPGGRLSIAEPVFTDDVFEVVALKHRIDSQTHQLPPSSAQMLRLMHRWKSSQYPDTLDKMALNPMTNYTERDLFRRVNDSGFAETRLEFHVESVRSPFMSWQLFLDTAPHPLAKPLRVILGEQFTPDERQFFEESLRPIVETQQLNATSRMAYITAQKPLL